MTITRDGKNIKVGKDFVQAVCGLRKSHGSFDIGYGINKKNFKWDSSEDIAIAEKALRQAVIKEGKVMTCFNSQAI